MLASGRRNQNTIWSLLDEAGTSFEDETSLKDLGESHFANIFKDDGGTSLYHQLKVILLYPRMIPAEKDVDLTCQVTLGEVEIALKSFKKDRSPGPDGWPIEFYLHFFDLMGSDLLSAVDMTRVSRNIPSSLNSTFIALIPKKDKP